MLLNRVIQTLNQSGLRSFASHTHDFVRAKLTPYYMLMWEHVKKPEKKIVFSNFAGKGYGGDPKAICDELIKRDVDAELVWLVREDSAFPEKVVPVKIDSFRALRELATAKIWIDNCRKGRGVRKGKGQFYLQTWHGGGPCLKLIEGDAEAYLSTMYIEDAKNDTRMADLFISDCKWQNETYRRAFWYEGEILECTSPPNDIFYQDWRGTKDAVFRYFGLNADEHVLLYAPTFRNDHSTEGYDLDCEQIIRACEKKFGGTWRVVVRLHPTMSESRNSYEYSEHAIDGTGYPQIESLLVASDILITDFSASMFLAFRWKIKCFLYASDYESFVRNERPLYFDLESLPAPFSHSNDAQVEAILGFDQSEYESRCEEFASSVGFFDGGHSVKTIADRIVKELGGYNGAPEERK